MLPVGDIEERSRVNDLRGKWSGQSLNDLSSDDGEHIWDNVTRVECEEVIQKVQVVGVDVVEGLVSIGVVRKQHEHDMDAGEPCVVPGGSHGGLVGGKTEDRVVAA
jgi:hypothetical protein